jgi:acetyl esterase/lipase
MRNAITVFLFLLIARTANAQPIAGAAHAQQIFHIWPGPAPGSESWNWPESQDTTEWGAGDPLAYNVTTPVLTYFPADPAIANGTAVIICPGGSFSYLHIKTEGSDVANYLNRKGVAAFVLKYRVVHSDTDRPVKEKNGRAKDTSNARRLMGAIIPLSLADGRQAIAYVRRHAGQWGISPDRIGMIGFSAGGTLASVSAFDTATDSRLNFVAPVYAYVPPFVPKTPQKDAPPLFIAAASDDELHLVPMSLEMYSKWLAAGRSAELHIYSKGGHGFGMNPQHQPSDTWIDRLGDWLQLQGFLNKN